LLQDMLIGVTHFFRDRESFAALEAHVPQLFAGKGKNDHVRVWVAGCSTGEEAYSIAMLLSEHAAKLPSPPSIQVFASDIDEQAVQEARTGLYPSTIEADVSQERLRRFFARDQGRYRVRKTLREKVLFSAHNVLSNAPFSRVDLISCRNLLIYLKRASTGAGLRDVSFLAPKRRLSFHWECREQRRRRSLRAGRFKAPPLRAPLCAAAVVETSGRAAAGCGAEVARRASWSFAPSPAATARHDRGCCRRERRRALRRAGTARRVIRRAAPEAARAIRAAHQSW
jgi:hypothetical protein